MFVVSKCFFKCVLSSAKMFAVWFSSCSRMLAVSALCNMMTRNVIIIMKIEFLVNVQALIEQYNIEKLRFESASGKHKQVLAEFMGSYDRFRLVQDKSL